jgi:hypothetical protein
MVNLSNIELGYMVQALVGFLHKMSGVVVMKRVLLNVHRQTGFYLVVLIMKMLDCGVNHLQMVMLSKIIVSINVPKEHFRISRELVNCAAANARPVLSGLKTV